MKRIPWKRPGLTVLLMLALYGIFIESCWIETTRHLFPARVKKPLKIAHLTDLHTRGIGRRERKMLEILRSEKPDLIVITGDTITTGRRAYDRAAEVLRQLKAPLGVYLVRGNWENRRLPPREKEFYRMAGIALLDNESVRLRDAIWLIGLDDSCYGNPDWQKAAAQVPSDALRISIFHSPGYFNDISGRCDLALAGHTHGGQIRIPFLPPLYLPRASNGYTQGWFARDNSRLFVSRGIGTSMLPMRLFCRPELAFITLLQKD